LRRLFAPNNLGTKRKRSEKEEERGLRKTQRDKNEMKAAIFQRTERFYDSILRDENHG
jgi:hypothetical protein